MCPIYANMPALPSEFLLGYTADGLFEIIMRPSKFFSEFFFQKIFFLQILVLYEFFDRVNSVYFFFFFFSVKVTYYLILFFSDWTCEGLSAQISPSAATSPT